MTTKDRLLKYIAHTGLATSRFENMCGLSNGYVRNLKTQIGADKLSDILNAFPELSKIWLLTGEGSMLVNNSGKVHISTEKIGVRTKFKAIIQQIKAAEGITQAALAEKLGLHQSYLSDMINERVPVTETVQASIYELFPYTKESTLPQNKRVPASPPSSIEEETKRVPLIPFEARGGQLDRFARNGVTLAQCETVPTPFKGAQFAISVRGQSMSPTYPSGCVLFISKNIADWVEWGKVYVLDTENGVIVKQLAPSTLGEDFVCCKSFNDAPEFAPFNVPKASIFGIYRVVGALIET